MQSLPAVDSITENPSVTTLTPLVTTGKPVTDKPTSTESPITTVKPATTPVAKTTVKPVTEPDGKSIEKPVKMPADGKSVAKSVLTTDSLLLKIVQSLDEIIATQKIIAASISRPVWVRSTRSQPLLGNEHSVTRPLIVRKSETPMVKVAQKSEPIVQSKLPTPQ